MNATSLHELTVKQCFGASSHLASTIQSLADNIAESPLSDYPVHGETAVEPRLY